MNDYFNSQAIGSSLLADCVVSLDPLEICTDRATMERKPTKFMEMGKIFEDLVEATYGRGLDWFWDKYFKSNISSFPAGVIEILDTENIRQAIEDVRADQKHYTKSGALSKTYERKFHVLDQIEAHDYRRPIPKPWWEKLKIMLERFKNRPFELAGITMSMHEWMSKRVDVSFQVEHFWETRDYETEREAHCRAKFDMVWVWEIDGCKLAIVFDLKCTGDEIEGRKSFGAFVSNWKKGYGLQSIHYKEGFNNWCKVNGIEPFDELIYYVIQESEEPRISHIWALHRYEMSSLQVPYRQSLPIIQKWIDDGKPIRGYVPQRIVNRYGREWREL